MKDEKKFTEQLVEMTKPFEIANPIGHQNLTIVPIQGTSKTLEYVLASDAIEDGTFHVREVSDSGDVNTLIAENKSDKRVLLLDGEELVGAKQNRILNTTILIEANTTQKIPVSCVEQGRWQSTSVHFRSGNYTPPKSRAKKLRVVSHSYAACGRAQSNQSEIWEDVEEMVSQLNAHSPTGAMNDAYRQRAGDFESYVKALPYPEGTRGILAAVSGRFVAMDVLDQPETFKRIWKRLITGYAVDAVRQKEQKYKSFSEKNAQSCIDSLADCKTSRFKAEGLGHELRFESNDILGQALIVEDCLLHMSVFPNNEQNRHAVQRGSRIMPPSYRGGSRMCY